MTPVFVVGEDEICLNLARALIKQVAGNFRDAHSRNSAGYGNFKNVVAEMNKVAEQAMRVLMIADGDQNSCIKREVEGLRPVPMSPHLCLRLAVKESEAWVMADREGFSEFADVSTVLVPPQPDVLVDTKEELLRLIRRSGRRILREEMLPKRGSRTPFGLGYHLHLAEFIRNSWSAERAQANSPSLSRAVNSWRQIVSYRHPRDVR